MTYSQCAPPVFIALMSCSIPSLCSSISSHMSSSRFSIRAYTYPKRRRTVFWIKSFLLEIHRKKHNSLGDLKQSKNTIFTSIFYILMFPYVALLQRFYLWCWMLPNVTTNSSQEGCTLSNQALGETRLLMQECLVQAAPLLKVLGVGRLLIDVVCRRASRLGRLGRPFLPGSLPRFFLLFFPPSPGLLLSNTAWRVCLFWLSATGCFV